MKVFATAFLTLFAHPAWAGELISGENICKAEVRDWKTGEFAGYYFYDSMRTTVWTKGPFQDSTVECPGTGRFVGMTGHGTYVGNQRLDGHKTTWFEGEVDFTN